MMKFQMVAQEETQQGDNSGNGMKNNIKIKLSACHSSSLLGQVIYIKFMNSIMIASGTTFGKLKQTLSSSLLTAQDKGNIITHLITSKKFIFFTLQILQLSSVLFGSNFQNHFCVMENTKQ